MRFPVSGGALAAPVSTHSPLHSNPSSTRGHLARATVTARTLAGAALVVGAGMGALPAWADVSPALDRFSISAGGFYVKPEFGTRVGTQYGTLDTGGNLKAGSATLPRVSAELLLFDSQGLSFDYYRYKRTWSDSANGSFGLGNGSGGQGTTTAAADVRLQTELEFAKLAYKWWMGSGNTAVGLGAGAAYYRLGVNASGNARVGNESRGFSADASEDAIAPLLEFGVRHAITPDLRLFADASGVWKKSGKAHGSIYNAALGVEWFPVKNVGLVVSYGVTDIDLKYNDDVDARLRVKLPGPSVFVKARF